MKILLILCWIGVMAGCALGVLVMGGSFWLEMDAIQQTSAFALALGCGILPYCFTRAFSEIINTERKKTEPKPSDSGTRIFPM